VTHENGDGSGSFSDARRSRKSASLTRREREPGKRNSLRKRDSSAGARRAVSAGGLPTQYSTLVGSDKAWSKPGDSYTQDFFTSSSKGYLPSAADSSLITTPAASMRRGLSHTESYLSTKAKPGNGFDVAGLSNESGSPSLTLLPPIQFAKDHQRRQRSVVLVKLWLMIAGFYRRAGMFDDTKGALDEAGKLVKSLEIDVGKDTSGSLPLGNTGWAHKRSIAELQADVFAEVSHRSLQEEYRESCTATIPLFCCG
jgi:cargo-transport protein YPP1